MEYRFVHLNGLFSTLKTTSATGSCIWTSFLRVWFLGFWEKFCLNVAFRIILNPN